MLHLRWYFRVKFVHHMPQETMETNSIHFHQNSQVFCKLQNRRREDFMSATHISDAHIWERVKHLNYKERSTSSLK